jgi:tetratricopeptide (TPR) repeat protein
VDFKKINKLFIGIVTVILIAYSAKTFTRNFQWKDRLTLAEHDISYIENSAQANNLLGIYLWQHSKSTNDPVEARAILEKACDHFGKATEVYPDFKNAWYDRGRTAKELNELDLALEAFHETVRIDSAYAYAYFEAALIYEHKKNYDKAITNYHRAILFNPKDLRPYGNLSNLYFITGKVAESIETNKRAIQIDPNTYYPHVNVGKTYLQLNDIANALYYFEKAFEIDASDVNLVNVLADLWRQTGNSQKAAYYANIARSMQ